MLKLTIDGIFKSTETKHSLGLFDKKLISSIELYDKSGKPYLKCFGSDKERPAKPEEIVRQLFIKKLIDHYGYPKERIQVEKDVWFGSGVSDKVALVDNIHDGCIASTGFFVFRAKENTLPEYVLPLCKSVLIQKQLEKLSSGTILTAVPKNLVESIIIPNMPKEVQVKIADLISQSHAARRKAKALLEEAKRMVEEMIEKGAKS